MPVRINARVRCGRVAAKTMEAGPPSLAPKSTALSKPTASMTASISAARSSSVRTCGTGSDSPDSGLVEQQDATERGEPLEEGHKFGHGPVQLDVAGERPGEDELDRSVPEHLIRQTQITARCVRRFRHGMSVLLTGPRPTVSTASIAPGQPLCSSGSLTARLSRRFSDCGGHGANREAGRAQLLVAQVLRRPASFRAGPSTCPRLWAEVRPLRARRQPRRLPWLPRQHFRPRPREPPAQLALLRLPRHPRRHQDRR